MQKDINYLKNEIANSDFEIAKLFYQASLNSNDALKVFKEVFIKLPEEEKSVYLKRVIHETSIFENYNVFEIEPLFKPYILAKRVSLQDIIELKKLHISSKNILRAMMFSPCEENYMYSLEYFCNEVEFFNWVEELNFRKIVTKWY